MKKCASCNVKYNGHFDYCPLCNNELSGVSSKNVFPEIQKRKKNIIFKVILFISLLTGIIFSFVEYQVSKSLTISKYVIFGLLTNYIMIKFIVNNYKNVLRKMNKYFWILLLLFFMWYFIVDSKIITTYIIPILCMVIYAFNYLVLIIMRKKYLKEFSFVFFVNFLIGFIPLLLTLFGLSTLPLLSYICVLIDVIFLITLIIFFKNIIIDEIKKVFNL